MHADSLEHVRDRYQFARELRKNLTPAERRLWVNVRARRLHGFKFHRQAVIGPFIADFVCFQKSLVIELDGGIHRVTQDYDRQRDQWLRNNGFRILRFWNDEISGNLDGVLQQILDELNRIPEAKESAHSGRMRYRGSQVCSELSSLPPLAARAASALHPHPPPPHSRGREQNSRLPLEGGGSSRQRTVGVQNEQEGGGTQKREDRLSEGECGGTEKRRGWL